MKKIIFLFLIVSIISLFSCGKMATRFLVTVHNKSFLYSKAFTKDKEILYLPMIHLNKPEYYQMIKRKVDSLRALGYSVYYESVALDPKMDSLVKLEIYRKFRNRVGFVPLDYFSEENQQHRQLKVKGYVMQSFSNTGVDPKIDSRADLSLDQLICLYEERFGKIELTDCDVNTIIGQKYNCRKPDKKDYDFIVATLRDEHLAELLLKAEDRKIVLLYGQLHENPLKKNLIKADSTWSWNYYHQKINNKTRQGH